MGRVGASENQRPPAIIPVMTNEDGADGWGASRVRPDVGLDPAGAAEPCRDRGARFLVDVGDQDPATTLTQGRPLRRRFRRRVHIHAVQIAKALGAEVTGVCSTSKLDLVRSLGADHVIDYSQDDFADGEKRYDLILDIGGNSSLSRLRRALTTHGTLVIVGGEGGGRVTGMGRQLRALALSPFVGQRLTMLGPREHYTVLERLTELIEGGQLVPAIEHTYPLNEMPNAMRHLQAGRARGKLVIAVSST